MQTDPLLMATTQRAKQFRSNSNANALTAENAQPDNPFTTQKQSALMMDSFNRGASDDAAQGYNAQWAPWFQNLRESGTTRLGVAAPAQSHGIADDPHSTFNTQTGPYGAYGSGLSPAMKSLKQGR